MAEIKRGDPLTEEILVELLFRAQADADPSAFDGIYLLYADRIFRYLLSHLGTADSAEDVTSQVFVHLIEKIGQYRIGPKDNVAIFSAWFYRMTYNKMVDILRRQKRFTSVGIEHASTIQDADFHEQVEVRMEMGQVYQAMQHLNEAQREVLLLRFIEEYSIVETAAIMRKTPGAVKALQHRALDNLRDHLAAAGHPIRGNSLEEPVTDDL